MAVAPERGEAAVVSVVPVVGHGRKVFGVATLVSYLSRFMALEPGDVILTGTPAGVGMGKGIFLRPGDLLTLSVDGLGRQDYRVTLSP